MTLVQKTLKNQKGLTLIELLAVIVILGIVAAIAIPSIGGIIENSKNDAKKAEAVQLIQSAKLYVASTNELVTGTPLVLTEASEKFAPYIDNVKSLTYTVTITRDAAGKDTYAISNHDIITTANLLSGAAAITSLNETQLLAYNPRKGVATPSATP